LSLIVTAEDRDVSIPVAKLVAILPPVGVGSPTVSGRPPEAIIDVQGTKTVQPGSIVKLDGSKSYDPDGSRITEYRWSSSDAQMQLAGQSPTISVPNMSYKPFYDFSLIAVSDNGESIPDIQRISVSNSMDCQLGYILSLQSLGIDSPLTSICIPSYLPPIIIGVVIVAVIIGIWYRSYKNRRKNRVTDPNIISFRVKTDGELEH
jgi:hypothetical protein